MIRNLSMTISGTDMAHYISFQRQAESFRYVQTQWLNEIHAYKVKSESNKWQRVDNKLFKNRDTFLYKPENIKWALLNEPLLILSALCWFFAIILSVSFISKKVSAL